MKNRRHATQNWYNLISLFLVLIYLAFILIPLIWIASTSLKSRAEFYRVEPTILPINPTFANYIHLFEYVPVAKYFYNSFLIATTTAFASVLISTFAGYAFARIKFPGRGVIGIFFLLNQMIPVVIVLIPLFVIFARLDLLDKHMGLIIAYIGFSVPICTWMLRSYFLTVPIEIEEAGIVDGASRLGVIFRLILPLALPGVAAVFLYAFVLAWGEFLFASTFLTSPDLYTLPVAANRAIGHYDIKWGDLAALVVVMTTPIVFLFMYLQRFLVEGLVSGGVKG